MQKLLVTHAGLSNFPGTQFPYVEEVLFYSQHPPVREPVQIPVLRLSKVLRLQSEIGKQTAHLLLPSQ